ncbi:MAG: PQQ-binding-like beta-propeller repeat protein [Candidatus Bathyarchaeia archaeon]
MKNQKNKTLAAITLVLTMTIAAISGSILYANAHTPAWSIKTYSMLSVSPVTVGLGQQVEVYMWLSIQPPTALGAYGDRWHGIKLTITKPDGTTETKGPFNSDPIGFAWTMYAPTSIGNYSFQVSFPGQTLAGENLNPTDKTGQEYIGDYFQPSTSDTVSIMVQQNPVPEFPATPIPNDYWTRPVFPENRGWYPITGNWLESPPARNDLVFAPYTRGPKTGHILWTKQLTMGGLVGGEFGDTSYYSGNAYEGQWNPPIIINGKLYYNLYPSDTYYGSTDGGIQYPRRAPLPGFACVDLQTGEQLWFNNDTRIDFGQIYRYDSPNQHGAVAYLWAISGSQWRAYDPQTGIWVYTINGVPAGSQISSSDGSIMRYQLNAAGHWLACWNSSAIPELLGAATGTQNWQWRPYGKTVNGTRGFQWNVTIPSNIAGAINFVFPDRILGSSGLGQTGRLNLGTANWTVWCLSLKPGQEGQLLWTKDYTATDGVTRSLEAANVESNVFTIWGTESRQHWGYNLASGQQIWGPTQSQDAWDYTVGTRGNIAYGKLFTYGYSGIVYCYDVTTGNRLWAWEAKDDYFGDAKWSGRYVLDVAIIADGRVYVIAGEHSPDDPKERGAPMACIDIETGQELWKLPFYSPHWSNNPAIADGVIVYQNIYDNRIYAIGKGPSATTVQAPLTAVPKGQAITITGGVTDESAGAKGSPAIADTSMSAWMQYIYMQQPIPGDAKGVPVILSARGPNGNVIEIGTVISEMSGKFGYSWTPPDQGLYKITATFPGSDAYGSSYDETFITVGPATAPAASVPPPPTTAPTSPPTTPTTPTPPPPTVSPTQVPQPEQAPGNELYVAAAAAVVVVVVAAAALLVLRRRK